MKFNAQILILLVTFALLNVTSVFSDEPPQKNEVAPEELMELNGHINIGASAARGNTDTEKIYLDGKLVARKSGNRYTVGAMLNYAEDAGVKAADNRTGSIKYDRFLNEKWYLYGNALFESDVMRDISLQISFGPGAGYQFWQTELMNLSVEIGLNYVYQDTTETDDNNYPAARWSANFDRYLIPKRIKLFHFDEVLVGLDDDEDVLIRSQTGFRFTLYKNFIGSAQFNYDWERYPVPGIKKADSMYIFTLGFQW